MRFRARWAIRARARPLPAVTSLVCLLTGGCDSDGIVEPTPPTDSGLTYLQYTSNGIVDAYLRESSGEWARIVEGASIHGENVFYSRPSQRYEWSPDGAQLGFALGNNALIVFDVLSGTSTEVGRLGNRLGDFSWHPFDPRLAYGGNGALVTVDADGSDPDTIAVEDADTGMWAQWSPDGTEIVFGFSPLGRPLHVIGAMGGEWRKLTATDSADERGPKWSPDGERVALIWNDSIVIARRDGSFETTISEPSDASGLAWSPDGSRLAFAAALYYWQCGEGVCPLEDIFVVDADGSRLARLTTHEGARDFDPAWSPDGSRIAFTSDRRGNRDIYMIDADGSDLTRVTEDDLHDEFAPRWRPVP